MRVLFLTQTFPRFAGDTSGPFIRDLARALVRGGDTVTVLAPHARGVPAAWSDEGVEVRTFRYAPVGLEVLGYSRSLDADERIRPAAGLVAPLYAAAARRSVLAALSREPFDVVHAHWVVPNGIAASSSSRRALFGVGLHGSDVFLAERPLVRAAVGRALAKASFLTGCSPELVARVCALGFPRARARVIPYGVDVAAFSPVRAAGEAWRSRLGIPGDAVVALGVGRMATKKGFHVLVQALPALLEERPGLHVVLAGGGDLLAGLRAATAALGGRVHFPGPVAHDDLPDLFRAADLFVLPAVHDPQGNVDGLPNVILEAMATALPVVATGISGIPLAVVDGDTGLLVAEGEAEPLRDALARLAGDAGLRRRMGEAGRRRAVAELTWDRVASRYREAYLAGRDGRVPLAD